MFYGSFPQKFIQTEFHLSSMSLVDHFYRYYHHHQFCILFKSFKKKYFQYICKQWIYSSTIDMEICMDLSSYFCCHLARIQIIQKTKADFSCIPCKRIGTSENKTLTRTIPILQITESSRKMFNNFTGVPQMDWNSLFYIKGVECDVGRKFNTEKQFSVPSW